MSKVISIHSYRGGTGKSNTTANLAVLLAGRGKRVAVIDTDIQSPGIHVLFQLDEQAMKFSLNDYLWGKCKIHQAAFDVSRHLGIGQPGALFLVPSSLKAGEIARILREGYDVNLLNEGFQRLVKELRLDYLMIDTHPGLNEETLLSIAISDILVVLIRPDQQDYLGTGVTIEVARKLSVPNMQIIVNKVPALFSPDEVKTRVENAYRTPVVAVLPHSDELMALGSNGLFVLKFPTHPVTLSLQSVVDHL